MTERMDNKTVIDPVETHSTSDIAHPTSGPTGPAYWRSMDELADTPQFREFVQREFPSYSPQMMLSGSRRQFLKIMGASVALAGLTGCRRWPVRKLAPYVERPDGQTPGEAEQYATAFELDGVGQPLVVTTIDGRPIKIEGNDRHACSRGAASLLAQASILNLYDPHRMRQVSKRDGEGRAKSTRAAADAALKAVADQATQNRGAGLTFLCEPTSSPTFKRLQAALSSRWPGVAWVTHQPLGDANVIAGCEAAFGAPMRPQVSLKDVDVIVSLESDFLMAGPDALRLAGEYADRRRQVDHKHTISRLYVAEPSFTVTGTNADERLAISSLDITRLAVMIAGELGVSPVVAGVDSKLTAHAKQAAKDLQAAGKRAVVIAGPNQPAEVHALIAAINAKLGGPVGYIPAEKPVKTSNLPSGTQTLIIVGGNPAYDGPSGIADQIAKVPTSFHLSLYENETSHACTWSLPRAHYLEAWGDTCAADGSLLIVQPMILPLFEGRSSIELLAGLHGGEGDGLAHVQQTYGQAGKGWRKVLHDGFDADRSPKALAANQSRPMKAPAIAQPNGYELVFRHDYKIHDGSFADNGWLQELPDPVNKLTWDNAALISLEDAKSLGISNGELLAITLGSTTIEVPANPLPGHPRGTITLPVGYGRPQAGPVGKGVGHNIYPLLAANGGNAVAQGAKVAATGKRYDLVVTQDHFAIVGDDDISREEKVTNGMIRSANLATYKAKPKFAIGHKHEHVIALPTYGKASEDNKTNPGGKAPEGFASGTGRSLQPYTNPLDQIANAPNAPAHQWGMVIDLNTCIGCNACVIACQAENNVPIVGKSQVKMNREMHWLRIDRYYTGDPLNPDQIKAVHQPVMCVHCENAPCEPVCPVAATVHDSEGMNVMVYNRCIGTRYCSNNCPYKVRRFNYFDWNARDPRNDGDTPPFLGIPDQQQIEGIDPIRKMAFNPEVTVRMRGVMEKCTYCSQRVQSAKQNAYAEHGQGHRDAPVVADGEIKTACQQTCPTQAITFGNLKDPASAVAKLMYENPRSYSTLSYLNVRPRTNYLARITNPVKQEVEKEAHHGGGHKDDSRLEEDHH